MNIRSNVHTHSSWCDGLDTTDDIVKAALALGFTDLGFSSHAPSPEGAHGPVLQDETGYRADIARLKAEHAGRLTILCGIEKDYYEKADPALYDYTIGDVHFFPRETGGPWLPVDMSAQTLRKAVDEAYGGDALAAAKAFYALSVQNVRENRPDIVGHFDLIAKYNADGSFFDEEGATYQGIALEAFDEILSLVSGYGGMVEMNLSQLAKGRREAPYPALFLLRHAAQRGARILPTSDSHRASTLAAGFEQVPALLQNAGLSSMALLQNGVFVDVKVAT